MFSLFIQYLTALPLRFMYVVGFSRITFRPFRLVSHINP